MEDPRIWIFLSNYDIVNGHAQFQMDHQLHSKSHKETPIIAPQPTNKVDNPVQLYF